MDEIDKRQQAEDTLRRMADELGTKHITFGISADGQRVGLICTIEGVLYTTHEQSLNDAFAALMKQVEAERGISWASLEPKHDGES